jgi:hypothetical protein
MCSGSSINTISLKEWDIIHSHDSIALNWFCKGDIPTTFYLVREQCTTPKKITDDQTMEMLVDKLNELDPILIISAMLGRPDNFQYADNLDMFTGRGYVFPDIQGKVKASDLTEDIFSSGLHHGKCTLTNILNFAIGMKYEKVVFFGLDLTDSRYFWLADNETNKQTLDEGRDCTTPHLTLDKTMELIELVRDARLIDMEIHNLKSPVAQLVRAWRF